MNFLRPLLLGASIGFVFPTVASARMEREVAQSFPVTPGGLASLAIHGGDITVVTGESDRVEIVATLVFPRANSDAAVAEIMADLDLTMEQTDTGVVVTTQRAARVSGWFGRSRGNAVSVHLHATVPADFNLDARTSGGDIVVANLRGDVVARTSGGNIEVGHILGSVQLNTSGGDLKVGHAVGPVRVQTSGGDVRVDLAEGPVSASTSGGDVHLGRVVGDLRATTSGGDIFARIEGPLTADALLSTSGGNVTATVDDGIAFNLDARTSGGKVKAQGITLRIDDGGVGKKKLVGAVNGGGALLKLRTSGGNVSVKTS